MTRRHVLAASAALPATPALAQTARPLPAETDVVVIGAGAAGIAAARRLQAAGRSVIVLEAKDRSGEWAEQPVQQATVAGVEDAILVRARQIRIGTVTEKDD